MTVGHTTGTEAQDVSSAQVRLPTEEVDDVAALRPAWRKLLKLASDISTDLHGLQASLTRPSLEHRTCII